MFWVIFCDSFHENSPSGSVGPIQDLFLQSLGTTDRMGLVRCKHKRIESELIVNSHSRSNLSPFRHLGGPRSARKHTCDEGKRSSSPIPVPTLIRLGLKKLS